MRAAGPQGPQSPSPVFRAGVDYVTVDVVVTDDKNHPIRDLTAADFEITEHGQAQSISDFKYISIPVSHRTIDLKATSAPPADVATNALPSPNSRLFVLVVDDLHLIESAIVPVKRVMTDFVSKLSPDDEVGIVFVGHSDLSVNITRDTGLLTRAINNVRGAFGFGLETPSVAPGQLAGQNLAAGRSVAWELKNVAGALARSGHARRAIVFVSGGTALDPASPIGTPEFTAARAYQLDMDDAFDTAKRADVPIYTIDPRGIPTPDTSTRGWGPRNEVERENLQHRIVVQQDHVSEIAINTGGRAFINQSNLTGAIDEIVGENGSFYLLGYSPNPYTRDGRFHDISVKVSRPGAHVRARKGYVATDDATTATVASTLDAAMGAGSDVGGLTVSAWAAPMAPGANGMTTAVTIAVTYPAPPDGSAHVEDSLETSVLALGPDGETRAVSSKPWRIAGTARKDGTVTLTIDDVIDLPAKPTTLRIGVASQLLRQAGTVQMPIEVPNPGDDKLQLGGIALAAEPGAAETVPGADAFAALVPFQPTTTRSFTAADTLRVFARAFWGGRPSPVFGAVAIAGPSAIGARTLALTAGATPDGRQTTTIDTRVPLTGLAAGDYVLDLSVQLAKGKPVHRGVPFRVR